MKAALDLGTNSVRLLVAENRDGKLHTLRKEARVTRLGQGVDQTGRLSEAGIARSLAALLDLAAQIPPGASKVVFATSAVRDASNRAEFAQLIQENLGVPLEILSGAEEAELSFQGAVSSLEHLNLPEPISVVDIGGGSTEIYTGLSTGELLGGGSVQVGAVRMLERFITAHPLLELEKQAMEAEVEELLKPLASQNLEYRSRTLIAVGGTATSLAALIQDLPEYSDEKVTGFAFSQEELREIYEKLGRLSLEERRQLPALQKGREDVIVCGAAILLKVVELMGFAQLYCSAWDLLYGRLARSIG